MKLNTPSERFFLFMAITMLFGFGYQHYFNYKTDKRINKEMAEHNVLVGQYCTKYIEAREENVGLKHDLLHAKSENISLVEQIDHVAGYYQIQVIKLKDEIIDLKYGDKK